MAKMKQKLFALLMAAIMTLSVPGIGGPLAVLADTGYADIGETAVIRFSTDGSNWHPNIDPVDTGKSFQVRLNFSPRGLTGYLNSYYEELALYVPVAAGMTGFVSESEFLTPLGLIDDSVKMRAFAALGYGTWSAAADADYVWYAYDIACATREDVANDALPPNTAYPGINLTAQFSTAFQNGITPNGAQAPFGAYIEGTAGGISSGADVTGVDVSMVINSAEVSAQAQTAYQITKAVPAGLNSFGVPTAVETALEAHDTDWQAEYASEWQFVTYRITLDQEENFSDAAPDRTAGGYGSVALLQTGGKPAISITENFLPANVTALAGYNSGDIKLVGVVHNADTAPAILGISDVNGEFTLDADMITTKDGIYAERNTYDVVVAYKKTSPAFQTGLSFVQAEASADYNLDSFEQYYKLATENGTEAVIGNEAELRYTLHDAVGVSTSAAEATTFLGFSAVQQASYSFTVNKQIRLNGGTAEGYVGDNWILYPPTAGAIEFRVVAAANAADAATAATAKDLYGIDITGAITKDASTVTVKDLPVLTDGTTYWVLETSGIDGWPLAEPVEVVANKATLVSALADDRAEVQFQKLSRLNISGGGAIAGAGFTVYTYSGGSKGAEVTTASSAAAGHVRMVLPQGSYIIEETTVPAGYDAMPAFTFDITSADLGQTVYVTTDGTKTASYADAKVYNPPANVGALIIQKEVRTSAGTAMSTEDVKNDALLSNLFSFNVYPATAETITQAGSKIPGFAANPTYPAGTGMFEVTDDDLLARMFQDLGESTPISYAAFGETNLEPLTPGWYWVDEAYAEGYDFHYPKLVYIWSLATTLNEVQTVTFSNTENTRAVYVQKTGSDAGDMASDGSDYVAFQLYRRTAVDGTFTAGTKGTPIGDEFKVELVDGEYRAEFTLPYDAKPFAYYLVETSTKDGYYLPTETDAGYMIELDVTGVSKSNYAPVNVGLGAGPIVNTTQTKVTVTKYSMENGNLGSTPIGGAQFYLESDDGTYKTKTYTLDSSGSIEISLPAGNYKVIETQAPPNHIRDALIKHTTPDGVTKAANYSASDALVLDACAGSDSHEINLYNEVLKQLEITKELFDQNGQYRNIANVAGAADLVELLLVPGTVAAAAGTSGTPLDLDAYITQLISLGKNPINGVYTTNGTTTGMTAEEAEAAKIAFSSETGFYILQKTGVPGYQFTGPKGAASTTETFVIGGVSYTGYHIAFANTGAVGSAATTAVTVVSEINMGRIRVYNTEYDSEDNSFSQYDGTPASYNGEFHVFALDDSDLPVGDPIVLYTGTDTTTLNAGTTGLLVPGRYLVVQQSAPISLSNHSDEYPAYIAELTGGVLGTPNQVTTAPPQIIIEVKGGETAGAVFYNHVPTGGGSSTFLVNVRLTKFTMDYGTLTRLDGAEFELQRIDPATNMPMGESETLTTGTSGNGDATSRAFVAIKSDTALGTDVAFKFLLVETASPGYILDSTPREIILTWDELEDITPVYGIRSDETYWFAGDTHIPGKGIQNSKSYTQFRFRKQLDGSNGNAARLANSLFYIVDSYGNPVNNYTIDSGAIAVPATHNGKSVSAFTPNSNAVVRLNVLPGTYHVVEIAAPNGYLNTNEAWWLNPSVTTTITAANPPLITLNNPSIPTVTVYKRTVDTWTDTAVSAALSDATKVAAGADFQMYDSTAVTETSGSLTFDLSDGNKINTAETSGANGAALMGQIPTADWLALSDYTAIAANAASAVSKVYYVVETGADDTVMYFNAAEPPVIKVTITQTLSGTTKGLQVTYETWRYTNESGDGTEGAWAVGDIALNLTKPHIQITKKNLDMGNVLSVKGGVTFTVYAGSSFADAIAKPAAGSGTTADDSGMTKIFLPPSKPGESYFLVEDMIQEGYSEPIFNGNSVGDPVLASLSDQGVHSATLSSAHDIFQDEMGGETKNVLQFRISETGGNLAYTAVNRLEKGKIILSKAADTLFEGEPFYLRGARFSAVLLDEYGNAAAGFVPVIIEIDFVDALELEAKGIYRAAVTGTSEEMPVGNYKLTETVAPLGFVVSSTEYFVTVLPRRITTIDRNALENTGVQANLINNSGTLVADWTTAQLNAVETTAIIGNAPSGNRIQINKRDINNKDDKTMITAEALEESIFRITKVDSEGVPVLPPVMVTNDASIPGNLYAVDFLYTDGTIISPMLDAGRYLVEELQAPAGYTLSDQLYPEGETFSAYVVIAASDIGINKYTEVTFYNAAKIEGMKSYLYKTADGEEASAANPLQVTKALSEAAKTLTFEIGGLAYTTDLITFADMPYPLPVRDFVVYDGDFTLRNGETATPGIQNFGLKSDGSWTQADLDDAPYKIGELVIGQASHTDSTVTLRALVTLQRLDGTEDVVDVALSAAHSTPVALDADQTYVGFTVTYYTGTYKDGGDNEIPKGFQPSVITYTAEYRQTAMDSSRYEIGKAENKAVLQYTFKPAANNTTAPFTDFTETISADAVVIFPDASIARPVMQLTKTSTGATSVQANGIAKFELELTNVSSDEEQANGILIIDRLPNALIYNEAWIASSGNAPIVKLNGTTLTPGTDYAFSHSNGVLTWRFDQKYVLEKNDKITIALTVQGAAYIVAEELVVNTAYATTYLPMPPSKYYEDGPWVPFGDTANKSSIAKFADIAAGCGVNAENIYEILLKAEATIQTLRRPVRQARKLVANEGDDIFKEDIITVIADEEVQYRLMLFGGNTPGPAFNALRVADVLPTANNALGMNSFWNADMLPTLVNPPVMKNADGSALTDPAKGDALVTYTIYYYKSAPGTTPSVIRDTILNAARDTTTSFSAPGWTTAFTPDAEGFVIVFDDPAYSFRNVDVYAEYTMKVPKIPTSDSAYLDTLHKTAYNEMLAVFWDVDMSTRTPLVPGPVGIRIVPAKVAIGGHVWHDANYNGLQDETAAAIAGSDVKLYQYTVDVKLLEAYASANGIGHMNLDAMTQEELAGFYDVLAAQSLTATHVGTVSTDADGLYYFENVMPYIYADGVGTNGNVTETILGVDCIYLYRVHFGIANGYTGFTAPVGDLKDADNSNADPATGYSNFIYVTPDMLSDNTVDAGLVRRGAVRITKDIVGGDLTALWKDRSFEIVLEPIIDGKPVENTDPNYEVYIGTIDESTQTITISGIAYGRYLIRELGAEADFRAHWATASGETATLKPIEIDGAIYQSIVIDRIETAPILLDLTNTEKAGTSSITITKSVVESGVTQTTWDRTFTINLYRQEGGVYVLEEKAVLSHDAPQYTFLNLDAGVYRIFEENHQGYVVSFAGHEQTDGYVILNDGQNADVDVTNTAQGGRLVVQKLYHYNGEAQTAWSQTFTIRVSRDGDAGSTQVLTFNNTTPQVIFLDPGTYTITEDDAASYSAVYTINGSEGNNFTVHPDSFVTIAATVSNSESGRVGGGGEIMPPPPIVNPGTPGTVTPPNPTAPPRPTTPTPTPNPGEEEGSEAEDETRPLDPIAPTEPPIDAIESPKEDAPGTQDGDTPWHKPNPITSDIGSDMLRICVLLMGALTACIGLKKRLDAKKDEA